jgi:hypothetical protein
MISSKFQRIFYFTLLDRLMSLARWLGVLSRRRINYLDLLSLAFRLFLKGFTRLWTWQLRGLCISLMRRRLGICFHSILQVNIPSGLSPFSLQSFLLGATLALATRAPDNKHLLRIYDTRRRLPKATYKMELEPFPIRDDFEGEVNDASFSPDGT